VDMPPTSDPDHICILLASDIWPRNIVPFVDIVGIIHTRKGT